MTKMETDNGTGSFRPTRGTEFEPRLNRGASIHSESYGHLMTYAEFALLPEQRGLQLIDGFLVQEPSANDPHQGCVIALATRLHPHVRAGRLGKVRVSLDVILAGDIVLQPDLLFVSSHRMHISRRHALTAAPDLAVEILSPSTRHYDLGRKRQLYFEYGCTELWIVDLDAGVILQHVRGQDGWEERELTRDDTLISTAVPGFTLKIAEALEES